MSKGTSNLGIKGSCKIVHTYWKCDPKTRKKSNFKSYSIMTFNAPNCLPINAHVLQNDNSALFLFIRCIEHQFFREKKQFHMTIYLQWNKEE